MRNPFREWRELCAQDARIAERAEQRIARDRVAAGHQDPEIEDPEPEARAEPASPGEPPLMEHERVLAAAGEAWSGMPEGDLEHDPQARAEWRAENAMTLEKGPEFAFTLASEMTAALDEISAQARLAADAAEREAKPGQVRIGPCDRIDPEPEAEL